MNRILFLGLLAWALGGSTLAPAQQLLCERQLPGTAPQYQRPAALLRLQADSLRLVSDYYPAGPTLALQARVHRLNISTCDTLSAGPTVLRVSRTQALLSATASNRFGQVLVAQDFYRPLAASGNRDSSRIVLELFNRNGTTRWRRVVPPQSTGEGVGGVIEAPGGGFFLFGSQTNGRGGNESFIIRLDSLGQVQWRRTYGQRLNFELSNPVYTRTGTLLLAVQYPVRVPVLADATGVMEFNQRGDSLTTHRVVVRLLGNTTLPMTTPGSLLPLRDGGFALVGRADSTNAASCPFLARLDRNLNVVWSHIHRQRLATSFAQPQELADGSLVLVASNGQSGRGNPFWLFRFAATGTLQQTYPFVSQVLPAYNSAGRYGYFGVAQGLQPLSDSSFVLVAGYSNTNSSRVYLAHLRVPGLPRVIDSHLVPPATPLTTHRPRPDDADLDLYPNPAREALFVRFPHPARLVLRDALGRPRAHWTLPGGTAPHRLPLPHLPPGLYLATLEVDGQVRLSRKLLLGP